MDKTEKTIRIYLATLGTICSVKSDNRVVKYENLNCYHNIFGNVTIDTGFNMVK